MLGGALALHSKTQMENMHWSQHTHLVVLFFLGMVLIPSVCQSDSTTAVYIVTLRQAPASHYHHHELITVGNNSKHGSSGRRRTRVHKQRYPPIFVFNVNKLCSKCINCYIPFIAEDEASC